MITKQNTRQKEQRVQLRVLKTSGAFVECFYKGVSNEKDDNAVIKSNKTKFTGLDFGLG